METLTDARTLAKYIVNKCTVDERPISNLQLQKILYFLQIMFCKASNGRVMLFGNSFQAWRYGPVLPEVYSMFSHYGGGFIDERFAVKIRDEIGDDIADFIDEAVESLRDMSPWELVALSHAEGLPWHDVYEEGMKNEIPNSAIVEAAVRSPLRPPATRDRKQTEPPPRPAPRNAIAGAFRFAFPR